MSGVICDRRIAAREGSQDGNKACYYVFLETGGGAGDG